MAQAVAEGARETGAEVVIRHKPEFMPEEAARQSQYKLDQAAQIATVDELPGDDAIVISSPTRYGNMAVQMKQFGDQTDGLWAKDALVDKVGGAFTSTASQHGGQETTLTSIHTVLLHLGLVVVGLPYSFNGQTGVDAVKGGSPYGATTLADGDGSRTRPNSAARFHERHTARIAAKLTG